MQPTMKLRIVLRQVPAPEYGENVSKAKEVHQQWWEDKNIILSVLMQDKEGNTLPSPVKGEWRDIPIEVEE